MSDDEYNENIKMFWRAIKATKHAGRKSIYYGYSFGVRHELYADGMETRLRLSTAKLLRMKTIEELAEYVETEIAIAKVKGTV